MAAQITALKEKLDTWLQGLSDSEQKLVKFGGGFFIIFVFYMVISSINTAVASSTAKLQQQRDLNLWAEQQIAIIKAAGGTKRVSSGSITQQINNSARSYKINIARLQPQKNDVVKVGLDDVGFNRLMQWLQELQTKHGIRAENIDLSKADEQGKVKVRRLDLARG